MTTLLLVRHGESEANKLNIFAGCGIDPELTETGLIQARNYAEYAVKSYKIDAVYSSPMKRAFSTAEACADLLGLEVTVHNGLREIFGGEWEGLTIAEIGKKYPEDFAVWVKDISHCRCTGGESVEELCERFTAALSEIAEEHEGKTVLIGTHYTPVRAIQAVAVKGSVHAMQGFDHIPNTSITEIFYDNGKWSAGKLNICDHLNGLIGHIPEGLKG